MGEAGDQVETLFGRVPAGLKRALVARAKRRGISANAQLILELEEAKARDELSAAAS
jgi:hypothetical protein